MLTLAEKKDAKRLLRFCEGSLLGTYLGCRLRCYGFDYPFVNFWFSESGGELTAVLGALDHTAVLLAAPCADFEELAAFLNMRAFSSVMTTVETARRCGVSEYTEKHAFAFSGGEAVPKAQTPDDLKDVYALIVQEIPGSFSPEKQAYLAFLSDFNFRKNRDAARAAVIRQTNTLCACALTAAETPAAAVLSGVASDPRFRGKGFGKQVVLSLANTLQNEGKRVYVIALNDSAASFYQKIGFQPDETIAFIERTTHV